MVIGVSGGAAEGIAPVEVLDIDKAVRPFIGADGPVWDVLRVPVDGSSNEVLVLLVNPPAVGQPPFICRKDGEGLRDGAVYVRGNGETREAKGDELALLLVRGQMVTAPTVDFDVKLVGEVVPVVIDAESKLDAYVSRARRRLLAALPAPTRAPEKRPDLAELFGALGQPPSSAVAIGEPARTPAVTAGFNALLGLGLFGYDTEPESRTEEQYRSATDEWEHAFRDAWPSAMERFIGTRLHVVTAEVVNRADTFFHDVELVVHLEGDVQGLKATDRTDRPVWSVLGLPRPPRIWGPRKRDYPFASPAYGLHSDLLSPIAFPRSISWKNTGSVTMKFDIGEIRPRGSYSCEDSDLILVVPEASRPAVRGTWQITARDHNHVYEGDLTIPIAAPAELTARLERLLGLDADEEP